MDTTHLLESDAKIAKIGDGLVQEGPRYHRQEHGARRSHGYGEVSVTTSDNVMIGREKWVARSATTVFGAICD